LIGSNGTSGRNQRRAKQRKTWIKEANTKVVSYVKGLSEAYVRILKSLGIAS